MIAEYVSVMVGLPGRETDDQNVGHKVAEYEERLAETSCDH